MSKYKDQDDKYKDDKHRDDKHKDDKHKDDKHPAEKHEGEKHKHEKHEGDKHKGDKHDGEKHKHHKHNDEKHKGDKHKVAKLSKDEAQAEEEDDEDEDDVEGVERGEEREEREEKEEADNTRKIKQPEAKSEKSEELHPSETVTNILLIRHGHTQATELGLLYSDMHIPLTEKGRAQSKLAANWAQSFKPDVILTGKATRVAQAAEPLAELTGLTPIVVKGFEEWNVGKWEGRTYLDIKKNDPEQYQEWCADPVNNAPPEGESIDDLVQRIGASLRYLIMSDEYSGKKIAMVTHSGIIRSIIVQALDMPVSNFWRIGVPTGSISRVNFSKNFATLQFCGLVPEANP